MQYKRISADCHLDMIWLPPDLFTAEAPRELKERMPFADLTTFSANPAVQDFGNLLTVQDMCRYVETKVGN